MTNTCPGAEILLNDWPHKTLRDQFRPLFRDWVLQIVDGLEHLEP
jgi:hypothetical protein